MKLIERTAFATIRRLSAQFPAVMVCGARQVGKTTLLRTAAEAGRKFVSLDDPDLRFLARNDPALFLQTYSPPVVIDEIQYAPQLLPLVKMAIDGDSDACGRFWFTGSQQFHLMRDIGESLAGRIAVIDLAGISQGEELGRTDDAPFRVPDTIPTGRHFDGLLPIYRRIHRGSFPALVSGRVRDWHSFYKSYVRTYLERDVHDLTRITDEERFLTFLKAAAARTGQLLNLSELARDVGIAAATARDWMGVLGASGIVHLLRPYSCNVTSRIVKTPKLYFADTGLCCYLTGWSSPETLSGGAMAGAMLETYVVGEILKRSGNCGQDAGLWFYRDKAGSEIDILIEHDGILDPVEVKKAASPSRADIRAFAKVAALGIPLGRGAVLCLAERATMLAHDVAILPIGIL
ncbi:MAG: ATP-binding protein [Kiritimatiellia bacterium]